MPSPIKVIDPLGYLEFLQLEAGAKLAITDSGGVEEETCVLKVPCVTLRDSTERWLTVKEGANILANNDPAMILDCVKTMLKRERNWKNPYGDGNSAKRIMEIVLNLYGNKE
jgi:UDP-N-acetylglucosamine 2-epimerase (non-hydrolysing)